MSDVMQTELIQLGGAGSAGLAAVITLTGAECRAICLLQPDGQMPFAVNGGNVGRRVGSRAQDD